jgi:hypothetical protein
VIAIFHRTQPSQSGIIAKGAIRRLKKHHSDCCQKIDPDIAGICFLLQSVIKHTFENQVIIITASSSLVFAVSSNACYNNIDYENDSVI